MMDKFKVLPMIKYNEYISDKEKIKQGEDVGEKISNLPKSTSRKLAKFQQCCEDSGFKLDKSGEAITDKVLQAVLYCIQGKVRTENVDEFLNHIKHIRFPKGIFAAKVLRELNQLKRKSRAK